MKLLAIALACALVASALDDSDSSAYFSGDTLASNTDLSKKGNGAKCKASSECQSGFCLKPIGVCFVKAANSILGKLPNGAPCVSASNCLSNFCLKPIGFPKGRCTKSINIKQCRSHSDCKRPMVCTRLPGPYNLKLKICRPGRVNPVKKRPNGAGCTSSSQCLSNFCYAKRCLPKIHLPNSCKTNRDCRNGYICGSIKGIGGRVLRVCRPPKKCPSTRGRRRGACTKRCRCGVGQGRCRGHSTCLSGLACLGRRCVRKPTLCLSNRDCRRPMYCRRINQVRPWGVCLVRRRVPVRKPRCPRTTGRRRGACSKRCRCGLNQGRCRRHDQCVRGLLCHRGKCIRPPRLPFHCRRTRDCKKPFVCKTIKVVNGWRFKVCRPPTAKKVEPAELVDEVDSSDNDDLETDFNSSDGTNNDLVQLYDSSEDENLEDVDLY